MDQRQEEDQTDETCGASASNAPWSPAPFLLISALLHLVSLPALILAPKRFKTLGSLLLLNHLLLSTVGMLPRSRWLGPNLSRLSPEEHRGDRVFLTFDDGPDPEVTPTVLELLDRFEAKASFFCIGERAAEHADLCREIVRRGHRLENHTQSHPVSFAFHGPRGLECEIVQAQQILTGLSDRRPRYFRAPAGIRNPLLEPILHRLGLRLTSWTRRAFDTVEHEPRRVVKRLLHGLRAGDILLLHDGSAARDRRGRPVVLEALPEILEALQRQGLSSHPLP